MKDFKEVELEKVFQEIDIETDYLRDILKKVLFRISEFIDIINPAFKSIHEGRIFNDFAAVTETGDIYIDSKKMQKLDEDVAMAIVAHELAHCYLGHYKETGKDPDNEKEADQLAINWGFNIEKMRKFIQRR